MTGDLALGEKILKYARAFPGESLITQKFLDLLQHSNAFLRTHMPGHITGSAFIVSTDLKYTLLVHHRKLNKWLQPGGHADGAIDVSAVALREANEETGLNNLSLIIHDIYDLDIHTIPARKDFPQHDHYDVRFLVQGLPGDRIVISGESHDVQWVRLDELERYNTESSLIRLRDKLARYCHAL